MSETVQAPAAEHATDWTCEQCEVIYRAPQSGNHCFICGAPGDKTMAPFITSQYGYGRVQ